jgi:hypothetical protein
MEMQLKNPAFRQPTVSVGAAISAWLTPKRVRIYASAIAGLNILAWTVNWLIRPLVTSTSRYLVIGGDFLSVYAAGRYLLEGRLNQLYDFPVQLEFLRRIIAPAGVDALPLFILPPFYAVVSAPFAIVPYPLALALWLTAGGLLLLAVVALFRRFLLPYWAPSTSRLFLRCLAFYPTLACFLFGQNSALSLMLYTAIFLLLRAEADFAAGLALGALLYKPHLALGFGLILLIQRRWKALAGGLVTSLVWLVIGFVLSPQAMLQYVQISTRLAAIQESGLWGEHNFAYFPALLLNGIWPAAAPFAATLCLSAGIVLLAGWWWRQQWEPGTRAWDFRMAASIALGLLISPHLYWYDLMLLLLPLGIVWYRFLNVAGDHVLDGGPVLAWTGLVYMAGWLSTFATFAQLRLTAALGLPAVGLQVSVPIILGWAIVVYRQAHIREQAPAIVPVGAAGPEVAVT